MAGNYIEVGAVVVSGDGKRLGTVKDVVADRFKLDRKLFPDYWLAAECVDHAGEGLVQLLLPKEGISAARVDPPEG